MMEVLFHVSVISPRGQKFLEERLLNFRLTRCAKTKKKLLFSVINQVRSEFFLLPTMYPRL
jgi:hypothetical protein